MPASFDAYLFLSAQVIEPVETDGVQLLQLLNTFLQLTELYVRGCWSHDSCHQQPPQPQQLRKLTFHRNSNLDEAQLIQLLSAPAGSTWAESSEQQEATAVQLPDWCTALWNSFRSSDSSDRCSATAAGPFLPAWKHLTHLDLTACSKLGASLCPLLALCPRLHTLSLHSCFKVTDATLRELCTVLNSATTSNCAEKPSSSSIDSQAVAAGGPMITTNSVSHAPAHTSCSQVAAGPPLRALDLSYTRVKDAGMPHLAAALPKLSWLGLKGCNVGDDGLVHLLQLQHLTALHIKHCHRWVPWVARFGGDVFVCWLVRLASPVTFACITSTSCDVLCVVLVMSQCVPFTQGNSGGHRMPVQPEPSQLVVGLHLYARGR